MVVEEHWVYDAVCEDYMTYGGSSSVTIEYEIQPDSGWMPDEIQLWFIQEGGGTGDARFDLTGYGLGKKQFVWHGYEEDPLNPDQESDVLVPMGMYRVYITMKYGPYGVHTLKKSLRNGDIRRIRLVDYSLNMSVAGLDEVDEVTPGLFLQLNDDDDNNNSIPDNLEENVTGEDDLVPLTIDAAPFFSGDTFVYLKETGAPGKLKIWSNQSKSAGTDLDISGTGYALQNSDLPITVYMEGSSPAATPNASGITIEICNLDDYGDVDDRIMVNIGGICDIDLDEDSDNNNYVFPYEPEHTYAEDIIENDALNPGRYVDINDDDDDSDGIPDYVDGFNVDGNLRTTDDNECADEDDFILITFDIKQLPGIPLSFDVLYPQSDPGIASYTPPTEVELPAGGIRIWRYSDNLSPRNKKPMLQDGDYLAPGTYPPSEKYIYGGYYVEGITAGAYQILFRINVDTDGDGVVDMNCEDSIKVTVQ